MVLLSAGHLSLRARPVANHSKCSAEVLLAMRHVGCQVVVASWWSVCQVT